MDHGAWNSWYRCGRLPAPVIYGLCYHFPLVILFNTFISPVSSLADSATMNMLGEERAKYGRIRLGGTIGWGVFAPIAGAVVQRYGLNAGFWSFSVIMLVNLLISQKFVHGSHEQIESNHGGIRTLLTNRRWVNFLFLAFLGGVGSFSVASYLFPYMAELGANESTMGIASSIATVTEVFIFFFGNRLVKKFGSYGLLDPGVGACLGSACCFIASLAQLRWFWSYRHSAGRSFLRCGWQGFPMQMNMPPLV